MKKMTAAMICFLSLTVATAQPAVKPASGYRIAGTVVNAASGEPVRHATVSVLAEEGQQLLASVESDDDGRFSLDGLPAGKYPLTASKRGFFTAYYDEHEGYNTAIVTGEGQETGNFIFRLVPGAAIRGVVSGDGGDPVENAKVMLFLKPHGHNPGARITQAGEASTDDTGAYEFNGLAAGEYLLAVTATPWYAIHISAAGAKRQPEAEATAALDVAYPVTYFDATTDEASATSIVLAGGSRAEANINLHAVPALRLIVQAPRGPDGVMALPNIHQTILGVRSSSDHGGFPDSPQEGMAEFPGESPGHYELTQGNPPRVVELDATTSQQVDPSLGTPIVAVSGNLQTSNGSPLPENIAINLTSIDSEHPRATLQTTGHGGAFTFSAVPPGSWELWAVSAKPLTISSLTIGSRTHPGNQLTVLDKSIKLTATVSLSETRIEGFARKADKGAPGVMVVLVPLEPAAFRSLARRDQSDSDGSFSLRDVAPGEYTAVAIENGWELDWARPEVISRYLSRGVAVTVSDGSGKLLRLSQPLPVQSR
jgi:hypothetical protein